MNEDDRLFDEMLQLAFNLRIKPSKCKICKRDFYLICKGGGVQGAPEIICDDCAEPPKTRKGKRKGRKPKPTASEG